MINLQIASRRRLLVATVRDEAHEALGSTLNERSEKTREWYNDLVKRSKAQEYLRKGYFNSNLMKGRLLK